MLYIFTVLFILSTIGAIISGKKNNNILWTISMTSLCIFLMIVFAMSLQIFFDYKTIITCDKFYKELGEVPHNLINNLYRAHSSLHILLFKPL